jgi:hypothetical protein
VLCLVHLGLDPGDVLTRMPESPTGDREETPAGLGYASDLRWLLDRLRRGEPVLIDCGADSDYENPDGKTWSRDRFPVGGALSDPGYAQGYELEDDVRETEADPLYYTERGYPRDECGVGYRIPLPPGSYRVSLHFSEIHLGGVGVYSTSIAETAKQVEGPRCFDVQVEQDVLEEYRPLDAGFLTADVRLFTTNVTDGMLDITFLPRVRDPVISAIAIERMRGS